MMPRSLPRCSRLLAFAIAGLLLALPVLGLRCETVCAEAAVPAPASSGHCASHEKPSDFPADAPAAPDDCRSHEGAAALKKSDDAALTLAALGALPLAPAIFAFPAAGGPAPEPIAGSPGRARRSRPSPLRL